MCRCLHLDLSLLVARWLPHTRLTARQHIKSEKYDETKFQHEFEFLMEVAKLEHVAKCLGRFDTEEKDGKVAEHFLVMEGAYSEWHGMTP